MSFDRPALLWLLAALPLVAAAFFVRRRRTRATVPDLDLWLAAAAARPRTGWRSLTSLASLLLNLAAATAASLAAAGPRFAPPASTEWAFVFDISASMSASDGRWEASLAKARAFARDLPPADRYRVFTAGAVPRAAGGWRQGGEEFPGLDRPGEVAADLAGAMELARGARTVVFTDGAAPGAEYAPRVAGAVENVAIEELAVVRPWASAAIDVSVSVANYGRSTTDVTVACACGARAEMTTSVEAGGRAVLRFRIEAPAGGVLEARVSPGGALAVDDAAFAAVPPLQRARVLVVAPAAKSPFLGPALASMSGMLADGSGSSAPVADLAPADVYFFDRCAPEAALERGSAVFFSSRGVFVPVASGTEVENPKVTAWAPDHALLAGLDLSRLRVAKARPLARAAGLTVLIDSSAGPLAVAGTSAGLRFAAFGFALEESNLPLLAAFPLLVRNCVEAFAPERGLPPARVGDWVTVPEGVEEYWREGKAFEHRGPWRADRPGVVVFRGKWGSRPVAVNFFQPGESRLGVPPEGRELPAPGRTPTPPWMVCVVAGLLFLVADWSLVKR